MRALDSLASLLLTSDPSLFIVPYPLLDFFHNVIIHPEIPPKPRVELPGHSPAQSAALAPPAGNDSPIEGVASRCLATSQKPAPSFPVLWFSTHKELPGSDTEVFLLPCKLLPS